MKIDWIQMTANCHVGKLNGVPVVTVERPQKNRPDGTKRDWRVVVLGDRYLWNKTFRQNDPRDLDSTKSTAEARVKFAISTLYKAIQS